MSTNLNSTQNHSINPRQPMNRRTTASKQTATRSRQKENNLIAKWLIALASIVVTLGGWGLMASQDVSASQLTSNKVAIATTSQQAQSVNSLRRVDAPQARQRRSQPMFITRTRSSR